MTVAGGVDGEESGGVSDVSVAFGVRITDELIDFASHRIASLL